MTSSLPTFEECVIVPLELFRERYRKTDSVKHKETNQILQQDNLPTDLKMKLFDHSKQREVIENRSTSEKVNRDYQWEQSITTILAKIQLHYHPFVKSIINEYIRGNQHIVSWNPTTFEIIVDGKTVPDSSVIRTFQHLLLPINSKINKPLTVNAEKFREKLIEIGVPDSWMNIYHHGKSESTSDNARLQQDISSTADEKPIENWFRLRKTPPATHKADREEKHISTPQTWVTPSKSTSSDNDLNSARSRYKKAPEIKLSPGWLTTRKNLPPSTRRNIFDREDYQLRPRPS